MVAETRGERKQKKAQQQHERDVDVAQLLRRHDVVGSIEMEQRHHDGDAGHRNANPAGEPIGGTFFLLDVFLGLAQLLFGNDLRVHARFYFFRHSSPRLLAVFEPALQPQTSMRAVRGIPGKTTP